MPLSDTRRYHDVVVRLGKLEFIHVVVDLYYECGRSGYGLRGTRNRPCRDEALRDLVAFVKDHHQRFPGRLKTVTSSDSPAMRSGRWCDSIEIDNEEIQRMLPPYQPQAINRSNWARISPHLEVTDFSNVHEVCELNTNVVNKGFLQRCRPLRNLCLLGVDPGCFDWAVQEKKEQEGRLGQEPKVDHDISTSTNPTPDASLWTRTLVPLTSVRISNCDIGSLPNIDALGFAFSQTLESLKVYFTQGASPSPSTIPIRRGWVDTSRLHRLEICALGIDRLPLNRLLIPERCPLLTRIKILDNTRVYSCQNIVPCPPSHFPQLCHLQLSGSSALSFNPATLASTKKLTTLKLSMHQGRCCFIPPVDEVKRSYGLMDRDEGKDEDSASPQEEPSLMLRRPQWTWDWQMPLLTKLCLNTEFAYMFEFKMLHGCPALTTLSLHMRTEHGKHTRVITQTDLFVPGAEEGSHERIVDCSLWNLYMNGHWSFENPSVLIQFVGRMFPKLENLTARAGEGVTVGLFVEAIRVRSRATMTAAAAARIAGAGVGVGVSPLPTTTLFWPRPSKEEEVEWGVFPYPSQHATGHYDRGGDVLLDR